MTSSFGNETLASLRVWEWLALLKAGSKSLKKHSNASAKFITVSTILKVTKENLPDARIILAVSTGKVHELIYEILPHRPHKGVQCHMLF